MALLHKLLTPQLASRPYTHLRCRMLAPCARYSSYPAWSTSSSPTLSNWKCVHHMNIRNTRSYRASWTEIDLAQNLSEKISDKEVKLKIDVLDVFGGKVTRVEETDQGADHCRGVESSNAESISTDLTDEVVGSVTLSEKLESLLNDSESVPARAFIGSLIPVILDHLNACTSPLTCDEWKMVGDKLSDPVYNFHKHWPGSVLKALMTGGNKLAIGHTQSLLQHVRLVQGKLSAPLLLLHLGVLGKFGSHKDQDVIYSAIKELRSITDVVEPKSSVWLISALCLTDRWMESFAIIDELSDDLPSLSKYMSPVAVAAFRNNSTETGWDIVTQLHKQNEHLLEGAMADLWQLAMHDRSIGNQLLMEMRNGQWIPSEAVAKTIAQWFESDPEAEWHSELTSVDGRTCQHCKQLLEPIWPLSQTDFKKLREVFLERSVKKDDIYQTSHPEELSEFQEFLDVCSPYDIVVDGLNIAWLHGRSNSNLVLTVIQELREKYGFRVLMIGRRHMKRWRNFSKDVRTIAQTFYLDDDTKDDPFMILAALHRGQDTFLVTRDYYKDHSFHLGPDLRQLFLHWQRGHQFKIHARKGQAFELEWPEQFERRVQQSASGWHLPYEENGNKSIFKSSYNFMCVSKKT